MMVSAEGRLGDDFRADVESVSRITAVPTILEVICRSTGMGFAAVARVTEDRWVACNVRDEIDFGIKPGGELQIQTTICSEVRENREPVIINHVAEDQDWRNHAIPAMYGFQSYISMPIVLADGYFFGTLCAVDPRPARLKTPETIGMFQLFAELIAKNLDTDRKLAVTENALRAERAEAELREQFIAVLGHDLRTPVRSIRCLMELLLKTPLNEDAIDMARIMRDSAVRMTGLIDNLLDLARGRLGGGLALNISASEPLEPVLRKVIEELMASQPDRLLITEMNLIEPVPCDPARIAQLFSNLLGNALAYGSKDRPVRIRATNCEGDLELSVANSGDPIPADAIEHLFQPFYRGAVQSDREGLGLGLFISNQIALAHGGKIEVESTPEQTRFTLRAPARPLEA